MKKIVSIVVLFFIAVASGGSLTVDLFYRLANLDFPLYKNERYYGDSKASELKSFLLGGLRVRAAQKKIAEAEEFVGDAVSRAGEGRVFHKKSHGCVTGKLNLIENRPGDHERATAVGLFDPGGRRSYDVLVRFSNGIGFRQHDKFPDVRGVAIKVFDVQNSETDKIQNVDLLMSNTPRPFGRDFLEFATFMDRVAEYGPTLGGVLFASHPKAFNVVSKATGFPIISNYNVRSVATEHYWSGHPYLLGPERAMKFKLIPTETKVHSISELETDLKLGPNYYQDNGDFLLFDLRQRLRLRSVKFIFALQLERNEIETPIEDNLVEWTEEVSPSIAVAELVLDRQNLNSEDRDPCKSMRFTPGHYIPEHRPLGNMGRGRIFGYEASQIGRSADEDEPDLSFVTQLREKNRINTELLEFEGI